MNRRKSGLSLRKNKLVFDGQMSSENKANVMKGNWTDSSFKALIEVRNEKLSRQNATIVKNYFEN